LFTEVSLHLPVWLELAVWIPIAVLLCLAALRPFSVLVALQFHNNAAEAGVGSLRPSGHDPQGPADDAGPRQRSPALPAGWCSLGTACGLSSSRRRIPRGLGTLQVRRLEWKTQLIQRIAEAQTAPAEPLNAVLNRLADHVDVDWMRWVQSTCPGLEQGRSLQLYAVRDDGPGRPLVTACPSTGGRTGRCRWDWIYRRRQAGRSAGRLTAPLVGVLRSRTRPRLHPACPGRDVLVLPGHGRDGRRARRSGPRRDGHAREPGPGIRQSGPITAADIGIE
jgi:hypothetical protein